MPNAFESMRITEGVIIDANSEYYLLVQELLTHSELNLAECWEPIESMPDSFFKQSTKEHLSNEFINLICKSLNIQDSNGHEQFHKVIINGTKMRSETTNSSLRQPSHILIQLEHGLFPIATIVCFLHYKKNMFYSIVKLLDEPFTIIQSVVRLPRNCKATMQIVHLT